MISAPSARKANVQQSASIPHVRIIGILRNFGETVLLGFLLHPFKGEQVRLESVKHTLPQQWKACSTIALPFDEFQLVHETFRHPVRVALEAKSPLGLRHDSAHKEQKAQQVPA